MSVYGSTNTSGSDFPMTLELLWDHVRQLDAKSKTADQRADIAEAANKAAHETFTKELNEVKDSCNHFKAEWKKSEEIVKELMVIINHKDEEISNLKKVNCENEAILDELQTDYEKLSENYDHLEQALNEQKTRMQACNSMSQNTEFKSQAIQSQCSPAPSRASVQPSFSQKTRAVPVVPSSDLSKKGPLITIRSVMTVCSIWMVGAAALDLSEMFNDIQIDNLV